MTRSFDLDAPSALEVFKNAVEKFKDDEINADLARDCACKAWHLCDHVFKALDSNPGFETLGVLKDHAKGTCPELAYLQDMCNEAKHGKLKRYWSRMDEAKFQDGDFSHRDFDPHDFDVPGLEIKVKDGQPVLFSDVVDCVVNFWVKFFDDNGIK